jgi:hypothetical protein
METNCKINFRNGNGIITSIINGAFVVALLTTSVMLGHAQAPKLMNYQGVARHADGLMIADQEIDLRISLISAEDIDRPVYTETHSIATNSFGLFSLKIGSGEVVYGSMEGIEWASAEHFITTEMDVDRVGQFTLMGTSQLVSVPYAFYAEKSGIAETTVDGSGRAIDFPGTNGQTIRHDGTDWEASSGLYHSSAGNIGIGTTSPSATLDVNGDLNLALDKKILINNRPVVSTVGTGNTFIGDLAGDAITTGSNNAFIGYKSGQVNTTGHSNAFIGFKAGEQNTSGFSNAFIGQQAGKANLTGKTNVMIGRRAGFNSDSGDDNVFIGHLAGQTNTGGSSNTYIGSGSNGATAIVNATAVGANVFVAQDSTVILGNSAKVGIGTSNPLHDLHVAGDMFATGKIYDSSGSSGTTGKVLSSTGSGTQWIPPSFLGSAASDSVWSLYGNAGLPTNAFLGTTDTAGIPFRTNNSEVMRITNGGGLLINSNTAGTVNTSGAGRKIIWNAQKGAFRVGIISGSQWDTDSLGALSVAMGSDPIASGTGSLAIGTNTNANSNYSVAVGSNSQATNNYALAIGATDTASGLSSTAIGQLNAATAYLSSAVGSSNEASGVESSAFGHGNLASDSSATAIGHRASATKKDAKAFGVNAAATGEKSTAIGGNVQASGNKSLAIGDHVKATGEGSIIIGNGNIISANPSAISMSNDSAKSFMVSMGGYPGATPEIQTLHATSGLYRAKVGIGKVPTTNLDVSGTLRADYIVLPELGLGNSSAIITNAGDGVMKWQNAAVAPFWNTIGANYFFGSSDPHYIGTTLGETGDLGFKINNKEVGRFTDGGAFLTSGDNDGTIPTGLTGAHLMWSPQKRAFRTIDGNSTSWDPANIGVFSFAHGSNAIASGDNAISLGYQNSASGDRTLAFGTANSATGDDGVALGSYNSVSTGIAIGKNLVAGSGMAIGSGFQSTATDMVQIGVDTATLSVGDRVVGINNPSSNHALSVHSLDGWDIAEFVGDAGHSRVAIKTSTNGLLALQFGDTVDNDIWSLWTTTDGDGDPDDFILSNSNMSSGNPMKIGPLGGATFWSQATLPALGISSGHKQGLTTRSLYNEFRSSSIWFGAENEDLVISHDIENDEPDIYIKNNAYGYNSFTGIGTSNPQYKLDVNGTFGATGFSEMQHLSLWGILSGPSADFGNLTVDTITDSFRLGDGSWGSSSDDRKINIGDGDYVYIGEVGADDRLEMKGTKIYANTSKFGVNTSNPLTKLHISSGNWDVSGGNGDMMIGNGTYNLKFGVADGGGGAGIGRINMTGGLEQLKLGGGGNDVVTITDSKVGIGMSPSYQLQLSTNGAAKPSSSSWTVASDARLKTDVREFKEGLDLLDRINPVWFTYNGTAGMPRETAVGTIAQELQKEAPYMVSTWEHTDDKGQQTEYLGVDYGAMDFVIINAIKELKERVEALEEENRVLRNK